MKTRFEKDSIRLLSMVAAGVMAMGLAAPALAGSDAEFSLPQVEAPEPGPVVTLVDAISKADSGNRSIQVLRQDIVIAVEKLRASWSGLLPTLYGSMNYSYSSPVQTGSSGGAANTSRNQLAAGLALNVPLIDAQTWLDMNAADIEADVTGLQVEQSRQVLLYSVAEAYFQAATALSLMQVYQAQYDAAMEHLKLAQGRLDAGVGDIMDVKSAQTDLVTAWTGILKAGYSLADARDALAVLMGIDQLPMPVSQSGATGADTAGAQGLDDATLAALAGDDSSVPPVDDRASGDRWDVKVLKKQQEWMKSQLKAAYMPFVPRLNGFFNYSVDILGNDAIAGYDRNSWNLGLSLSVPLFDYSLYPSLRQKKAAIRSNELQIDEALANAGKSVRESRRNVQKLGRLVAAARVKASLADDLLGLAEADYANGTGMAIAVTDARRTSQSAHVDLATATYEYEMGLLGMNRELGVDIRTAVEKGR